MSKDAPVNLALIRQDIRYYGRHRRWVALARVLWLTVVLRYGIELCMFCGRRYTFSWWSPQPLWDELMPSHRGSAGGGTMCPRCYDRRASEAGYLLVWVPSVIRHNGAHVPNHVFD